LVNLEAAADEAGARLMYVTGWDPQGILELFERFHKFGVMRDAADRITDLRTRKKRNEPNRLRR
jgi:predicted Zn-dependent protease